MISFFISWLIPLVLVWDLYTPGPSRGSLCAGLAVGATLGGATLTPLGAVLAICGALIVGRPRSAARW